MMRIIVCMKQVIDPEAPVSSFRIHPEAKRAIPPKGTPPVLNPFDENALEAALRIKDSQGAAITVISMGRNLARIVLKKSLAAGADKLILLEDDAFEDFDSYFAAHILAPAIEKIGEYDLVLCGREAADTNAGQVGSGIAEILGLPSVTLLCDVKISDCKATVKRVTDVGYEVVEVALPALMTVSHEIGEPRYPTIKGIIAAKNMEPIVWKAADIGIDPSEIAAKYRCPKMLKLFQPVRQRQCEIITGETPEEAGVNLALKLREAGIL